MDNILTYVPFVPSNYDGLQTVNGDDFYVKHYDSTPEVFILYKNTAEHNRVDKTQYLTEVGTIDGTFRSEASITNFAITIEYTKFIDFNYIYVPVFNRYYYVTDITVVRAGLYEISLSVDVLMSYKDALLNLKAFISRNEKQYNKYLIDNKRVIEQGYDVSTSIIENTLFKGEGSYVLTGFNLS